MRDFDVNTFRYRVASVHRWVARSHVPSLFECEATSPTPPPPLPLPLTLRPNKQYITATVAVADVNPNLVLPSPHLTEHAVHFSRSKITFRLSSAAPLVVRGPVQPGSTNSPPQRLPRRLNLCPGPAYMTRQYWSLGRCAYPGTALLPPLADVIGDGIVYIIGTWGKPQQRRTVTMVQGVPLWKARADGAPRDSGTGNGIGRSFEHT